MWQEQTRDENSKTKILRMPWVSSPMTVKLTRQIENQKYGTAVFDRTRNLPSSQRPCFGTSKVLEAGGYKKEELRNRIHWGSYAQHQLV